MARMKRAKRVSAIERKSGAGHSFFVSLARVPPSASLQNTRGVRLFEAFCISLAMLRRTAAVLFETARTQAALSSKRATAGALFDLKVSSSFPSLATRETTSTLTSSSFAAASLSRRRSYWNDGYRRFGDQQRGGGRRGNQQQDPRSTFRARPRLTSLLGGATLAAGGAVYYSSRETVPYTLRKHSILVSKELEISLGKVRSRR